MNFRKLALPLLGLPLFAGSALGADIVIENNITTDTTWTADNTYILSRFIFVEGPAVLTIEPGTLIRGLSSVQGGINDQPGTLFIEQGAKIMANGTPEKPIIFTAVSDTNAGPLPASPITIADSDPATAGNQQRLLYLDGTEPGGTPADQIFGDENYSADGDPDDNGFFYNGRWGGLLVLGSGYVADNTKIGQTTTNGVDSVTISVTDGLPGPTNPGDVFPLINETGQQVSSGGDFIEGLDPNAQGVGPTVGTRAFYGGTNDDDDSGCIRWVSIRYSGFVFGDGNELQGLTCGAVGRSTDIEWLESGTSNDDGTEWFGGSFDTRFLVMSYIEDDSFDGDEGYRGDNQFWFVLQSSPTELRSGFGNDTSVGSVSSDHFIEYDGPEPNSGAAGYPATELRVENFTMINTNPAGGGEFDLDGNNAVYSLTNGYAHNIGSAAVLDLDNEGDGITTATLDNVHGIFSGAGGHSTPANLTGSLTQDGTAVVDSAIVSPVAYTAGGLDPRLKAASAAAAAGSAPAAGLADARWAGWQLKNTALKGWTLLDALGVVVATNNDRVVPSVGVSGAGTATVNFDSTTDGGTYLVFGSTDGCDFELVGQVTDATGTAGPDGELSVDTGNSLAAGGSAIQYYVVLL